MPGIDGLEFARRLLEQLFPLPPPIVMLSSVGRHISPATCQELGISMYLTKPVTSSSLFDAINKVVHVCGGGRGGRTVLCLWQAVLGAALRILVTDDDSNNRVLLSHQYSEAECLPSSDRAGRAGSSRFVSRGAADLILMDLQMPKLSGPGGHGGDAQKLEGSRKARIPIIALTAHAMAGDRERCLAAGMDDYLSKPVRANDLLAKIAHHTSAS